MGLQRLWAALSSVPSLEARQDQWEEILGPVLPRVRQYLSGTGRQALSWPCDDPSGSCWRYLVSHDPGDIVGVCHESPKRCPTIPLSKSQLAVHQFDLGRLLDDLRLALHLEGGPTNALPRLPEEAPLGRHRFGSVSVEFFWSRSWDSARLLALAKNAEERDPSSSKVIVLPDDAGLDPVVPRLLGSASSSVEVVRLGELIELGPDGVRFRLADFVLRRRFRGVAPPRYLYPRYLLILDPARQRYWLGPKQIDYSGKARIGPALLMALARRSGEVVSNDDLYAAGWPELWGSADTTREDLNPRLRDQKSDLDGRLQKAAYGVAGLPSQVLLNVPGRTEADGAYRLDIDPDRVAWWSEPD